MNILELPDGLHEGVEESVYHARIQGLASKSTLDLFERSPAHYYAWLKGAEREASDALSFGSAAHVGILQPDIYEASFAIEPSFGDCRRKEPKALRDAWRAENEGRTIISREDGKAIAGMSRALREHPLASQLLSGGQAELTVRWTDAESGLICKARADYYVQRLDACIDLKTTEDARLHTFRQSVARYRYHVQQAFYSDGFATVGAPLKHFIFIAIEKVAPYAIAVYVLDPEALAKGIAATRRNLTTFAECVGTGAFPGYNPSFQILDLPAWA